MLLHQRSGLTTDQLRAKIRDVPDFPRKGILFRDITLVLKDPDAFHGAIHLHADLIRDLKGKFDLICGMESRGFLFGAALAAAFGVGFIPIRKPGKLPAPTVKASYDLEYGKDELHMHKDAVEPGVRALVVDDLLATGGTAKAATQLIEACGGTVVACLFMIELVPLEGRRMLDGYRVESVLKY